MTKTETIILENREPIPVNNILSKTGTETKNCRSLVAKLEKLNSVWNFVAQIVSWNSMGYDKDIYTFFAVDLF
jgi:hypothetical protein